MKFIIKGDSVLGGTIKVGGSKNTALKLIAASVIIDGPITLSNVPKITDVERMVEIFCTLGGQANWSNGQLILDGRTINQQTLPVRITQRLRGSVVFIGPLLARFGKAFLPFPGGCAIGERPLTAHLDLFEQCGVSVEEIDGGANNKYSFTYSGHAPKRIKLVERSVTATENAIMFGVGIKTNLVISNAAAEPEIDDLIEFLNRAGANVRRISLTSIRISKYTKLTTVKYHIKGDRIEAGTWMVAGALLGNNLVIEGLDPSYLTSPLEMLKECGIKYSLAKDTITISKAKAISPINLITAVYPGFPTDLQSPFGLLLTQANGKSLINEGLFDNRLSYLNELNTMGAKTHIKNTHQAVINGPTPLSGTKIESLDLRAGATMILAGLIASGTTEVKNAEIIDRGYENIDQKLRKVGANIKRIG